jgi:hypothetical protein
MRVSRLGMTAALAGSLLLTVQAVAGAASGISLTIKSPAPNLKISQSKVATLAIRGTSAFQKVTSASQRFYIHRDACGGTAVQNQRLSTKLVATDGGDGCGTLSDGAPNTVLDAAGFALNDTYPAVDGTPFLLDATKPITGTFSTSCSKGASQNPLGLCAGNSVFTFTIGAVADGATVTLGSADVTQVVTPATSTYVLNYSIKPAATFNNALISGLSLTTSVKGEAYGVGYANMKGKSFLDVPIQARLVEVGIDDPAFDAPYFATLDAKGLNWVVTINTFDYDLGLHTIYARALQGSTSSKVVTQKFTLLP